MAPIVRSELPVRPTEWGLSDCRLPNSIVRTLGCPEFPHLSEEALKVASSACAWATEVLESIGSDSLIARLMNLFQSPGDLDRFLAGQWEIKPSPIVKYVFDNTLYSCKLIGEVEAPLDIYMLKNHVTVELEGKWFVPSGDNLEPLGQINVTGKIVAYCGARWIVSELANNRTTKTAFLKLLRYFDALQKDSPLNK